MITDDFMEEIQQQIHRIGSKEKNQHLEEQRQGTVHCTHERPVENKTNDNDLTLKNNSVNSGQRA